MTAPKRTGKTHTGLFQSNNLAKSPRPAPLEDTTTCELAVLAPLSIPEEPIRDGVGGVDDPPPQENPVNPMKGDSKGDWDCR
jgi:hypothetical protein